MKPMKTLLLSICLFCLLISGCSSNVKESDAMKFKNEYEALNNTVREKDGKTIRSIEIDENNPIVYATDDEIVEKIENKDTFIVYFGFADCPWCRSVLETMFEAAKDEGISEIYYCDITDIRDTLELDSDNQIQIKKEGSKSYYKILEYFDNVLDEYTSDDQDMGEKRIYAPNIVAVVDGKATMLTTGISDLETDPYMKLTDDIKQDTYNQFKELFDAYTSSDTACEVEKKC